MGIYTIMWGFENPRRGRQARSLTTKNSRSQIVFQTDIFRKLSLGAPVYTVLSSSDLGRASWSEDAFSEAPSATFLTTVFMEVSSVFVTPKRKYSRNSSCSSTEASPEEKRAKEATSPDVTRGDLTGDLTFFKNLPSNSLPTGKSFQSIATKFPHKESRFYKLYTVIVANVSHTLINCTCKNLLGFSLLPFTLIPQYLKRFNCSVQ